MLDHKDGHISHHLGGGGHLYNVSQHIVDSLVHLLDRLELVTQAQALHLGLEVGILAPGHLIAVDIGGGVLDPRLKGGIPLPHVRPVVGELLEAVGVQPGVPLLPAERGDHRIEGGLAGHGGHGVHRAVHDVHPGLSRHQEGRHLVAGGIVGVEVDGNAHLLLEGLHQLLGGVGLQESGHILDAQDVGPSALQLLGHVHIVGNGVAVPFGVQNIASVADGRLADLALVEDLVYGHFHTGDPVEGVEDAEYVNAAAGGLLHKGADQIVRIVGVAHGVGAPEQHLEGDVGDLLPQQVQPLPGGLVEEPIGHVEGGPAPHLQGEAVRQDLRSAVRPQEHIPGPHPGGEQGLMGVPHGGVGDEELFLPLHPVPQGLGPLLVQELLEPGPGLAGGAWDPRDVQLPAVDGGIVYLLLGDVLEHLGGAVLAVLHLEELGGLVNELCVAGPGPEGGVAENVGDEGDIGLDAPDVLLPHRAGGPAAGPLKGVVPGGDLDQQGVVIGGDHGPGIGVAAVQADAAAAAGAIGGDLSGVGREVVGRVLGGDPALDGIPLDVQVVLAAHVDRWVGEGVSLGDEDLCPHQIDAGDLLGDGVLHLDAGIHLNKVVIAVPIHQKFHRAGVHIAHMPGDLYRVCAELFQRGLRHAPGRRELHHLLVPPLKGAVPLTQVDHVAVPVAQHLDLDMLRLHQVLFNEDIVVAEGLVGLSLHQLEGGLDLLGPVTAAHPAAAASGGRLEDDGKPIGHRPLQGLVGVPQGLFGAGYGGHAAGQGRRLGRQLVAHLGQDAGVRTDKSDLRLLAGAGEFGVLGEEPIARMDSVHASPLGQIDDAGDIQISPQGGFVLPDQVGLVGLGAEERIGVLIGIHGHRVQPQVITGPENPDGDLPPVGHQYLLEVVF